ncbi:hypothetical protein ACFYU5_19270 [Nocardia aobensis]|uniref:Uncharacterized protein n=1 Tax=Nocardia aobensis TaxID=257277 RepID=A0ABW6P5X3_9NOCA
MNFKALHTPTGVCAADWPDGIVQTQFVRVNGHWRRAQFAELNHVVWFDAPEIHTRNEAVAALHKSWQFAMEVAAERVKVAR